MKGELLKRLRNQKEYLSGEELSEALQVSRTAIWKGIQTLRKQGYQIQALPRKGYRLLEEPPSFSKEEIESWLDTSYFGREILFFEEVDSTNQRASMAGELGKEEGLLVVAQQQTQGRGRRGRSWQSNKGEGIYLSILLRPQISPTLAPQLTLLMAVAVAEGLESLLESSCMMEIKWPNDLLLGRKKVCGILTEMKVQSDYISHVVVGVGINLFHSSFQEELKHKATSIWMETGERVSEARLVGNILKRFEDFYKLFLEEKNLGFLQEGYEKRLANRGKEVLVLEGENSKKGKALGISKEGELLVERDGKLEKIFAGEVSIRGVDGYV